MAAVSFSISGEQLEEKGAFYDEEVNTLIREMLQEAENVELVVWFHC